jgi:hypothetical protein
MVRTIKSKSLVVARMNFTTSGGKASQSYAAGVAACTNFLDLAASDVSEQNWANGVTQAAAAKKRAKGLKAKVTSASWQADCQSKGVTLLAQRIQGAGEKWVKGYQPINNALNGMALPDKVIGDPIGNLTRIAGAVVKAEVNVKRAAMGEALLP